jgi:hypothetical protein
MYVNFGARLAARGARGRRLPAAGAAPTWRAASSDQGLATRAPAPPGLRRPRAHVEGPQGLEGPQGFGGTPRFWRNPRVLEAPN